VEYDTRNLEAGLAGSGIRCPSLRDCIPVMVNYVREHPDIPTNFGEHATSLREKVTTSP
jgi:hypothetical protein